ncbi:hypothetical protein MKX01_007704 [Papaver californicum]|nr:hypothetical protein MKX01_007704 [Papaver californicum]
MAKGHTIPLLHLTRLLFLHRIDIAITIFTTHANSPFIRQSLSGMKASVIDLTFPQKIHPEIPEGIESVDKLTSLSLLVPFAKATKFLQPEFDAILETLRPNVSCIISDGFLPWSLESASRLCIPRLVFDGVSNYTMALYKIISEHDFPTGSDDDVFDVVPYFPELKLTKNDFEPEFSHPEPGEHTDFYTEEFIARQNSHGIIMNSFRELEPEFVDYWNREASPRAWCIGPLCLASEKKVVSERNSRPIWMQWLDEMSEIEKPVLYVAFGSAEEITIEQYRELATGLENSGERFLWVLRLPWFDNDEFMVAFEERVKERGVLVKNEWVDQVEILSHSCVHGFMSHCGWNSVLESICESVPVLGFPITADQHLNARMVEEYFRIGVKVVTRTGSVRGFFGSACIEKKVKEVMNIKDEKWKGMFKNVKKLSEKARDAMEVGGSSWHTLNLLIDEIICGRKLKDNS